MQEKLRKLIDRHCTWLHDTMPALRHNLSPLITQGDADNDAVRAAKVISHQIKGSSGSVGFREISEAATRLDGHIGQLMEAKVTASPEDRQTLDTLCIELQNIVAIVEPQTSALYNFTGKMV